MSIELSLLTIRQDLIEKYAGDLMLAALWNTKYFLEEIRDESVEIALQKARTKVEMLFEPREIKRLWPQFETLIRRNDLPNQEVIFGSEWQRLDELFKRIADPNTRQLLSAAFEGFRPTSFPIEASYGACTMVSAQEAGELANALANITIDDLRKMAASDLKYEESPNLNQIAHSLGKAFGVNETELKFSDEFLATLANVKTRKQNIQPENDDLACLSAIAKCYEKAAANSAAVIIAIV